MIEYPIRPNVIDHGKVKGMCQIDFDNTAHIHKITVSKGITFLPLKIKIMNMQVEYELEVNVE